MLKSIQMEKGEMKKLKLRGEDISQILQTRKAKEK